MMTGYAWFAQIRPGLETAEVNRRWGEYMAPVMTCRIDPATGYLPLLERQWSLDR